MNALKSLPHLVPNANWASLPLFDRSGWKRVRFGDVVRHLKEETDPVVDGVERYVAGEHMETENVHIRKWGNVGEGYLGPAFIRRFRKGQVLYGSRRTYLKKVAMAEWDGVTANTTFVLETVKEQMHQELLPWLMLSERFTRHSIQESKGSTNPYINFRDIAKFEFDLPPLDQQRRIAEVLWGFDEVMLQYLKVDIDMDLCFSKLAFNQLRMEQRNQSMLLPLSDSARHTWEVVPLHEIAADEHLAIVDGPFGSSLKSEHYRDHGMPVIQGGFVTKGAFIPYQDFFIDQDYAKKLWRSNAVPGDIIMARVGENAGACAILPSSHPVAIIAGNCIRIRTNPKKCLGTFLEKVLIAEYSRNGLATVKTTTAQPAISLRALKNFRVPVPPVDEQHRIVERLDEHQESQDRVRRLISTLDSLMAQIAKLLFDTSEFDSALVIAP